MSPRRMHANVVTLNYKSPNDLKTAVAKLEDTASGFDDAPGFVSLHMVETSPTQTVHMIVFDTEKHLVATRDRMFPVLVELTGPHVASPPEQRPGNVVLSKTSRSAMHATPT